jgi:hypothetical protein
LKKGKKFWLIGLALSLATMLTLTFVIYTGAQETSADKVAKSPDKAMWENAINMAKGQEKRKNRDDELQKWIIRVIMEHSVVGEDIKVKKAIELAKERLQYEKAWLKLATDNYNILYTDAEVDEFISNGPDTYNIPALNIQAEALGLTLHEMNHVYDRDFYVKWVVWAKLTPILVDKYGIDLNAKIKPGGPAVNTQLIELFDKEIKEFLNE